MAESPNRKACDRCHTQKLSCKRIGDEPCARCIRLKTECKSSPSLRYRKHQSTTDASQEGGRPRKRVRTGSESHLVQPNFGLVKIQTNGGYGANAPSVVSPNPMLDMVDFNFGFDHSSLFTPNSIIDQHLSHQLIPEGIEELIPRDANADTWSPHLSAGSNACSDSAFISPTAPDTDPSGRFVPHPASQKQLITHSHRQYGQTGSERRSRPRGKQKARQIMLKPSVGGRRPPANQWMPQLSEINARLFELSSSLPQQLESGDEPGQEHNGRDATPEERRLAIQPFPIDEMFKLSKSFAEVIEAITPAYGFIQSLDNGTQQQAKALNRFADPGTSLFILSAYVRLLDMYQKVFSCIHSEISQLETGNAFPFWKLPDVTVGSFAVESTPSLQMSLTIQLAEEFLSQLRNSTAALNPALKHESSPDSRDPDGSSMFSGVVDVSFQAIKSREESIGRQLADLRRDIDDFLDG